MNDALEDLRGITPAELFTQLAGLPPSLILVRKTYRRASSAIVRQRRGAFSNEKSFFLQYIAQHDVEALTAMGLNEQSISDMRDFGMFPANTPGERMDSTVDHILSLQFGGTNDFENLVLIPHRINQMKNELEALQTKDHDKGEVITIVPTGNTRVPFIPGGFQRAKGLQA